MADTATEGRMTRSKARGAGGITPMQKMAEKLRSATTMIRGKSKAVTSTAPATAAPKCPSQVPSSDADSGAQLDQGMPDIQPLALDQMLGAETTLPQQPSAEDAPPHAPLPEAVLFKEFQQAQQEQQSKGSAQLAASPPPAEETGANADMASSPAHVSPPPAACPDTELQQAAFGTPFAAASPMLASPIPSAAATAEPAAQQLDASFAAAAAAGQPQGEAEAPAAAPQVQLTPVNSDGLRGTATKVLSGSTRRTPGLVPRRAVASPTPAPATNPPSSARVQSARVSATPTMAVNAVRNTVATSKAAAPKRVSIATPKTSAGPSSGSMRRPVYTPHPAKSAGLAVARDSDCEAPEEAMAEGGEEVRDVAMALAKQLPTSERSTADDAPLARDASVEPAGENLAAAAPPAARTPGVTKPARAVGTPGSANKTGQRPASATPGSQAKYASAASQFQALAAPRTSATPGSAGPKPLTVPVAPASYMKGTSSFAAKARAGGTPQSEAYTRPRVRSEVVGPAVTDERSLKQLKRELAAATEAAAAHAAETVRGLASDDDMEDVETTYNAEAEAQLVDAMGMQMVNIGKPKNWTELRGVPLRQGSHMHFGDDGQVVPSPGSGVIKLKGVPTPKGRHMRF